MFSTFEETMLTRALLALPLVGLTAAAPAQTADPNRPNPAMTPGAVNPGVTQASIAETICKRGWSSSVRPPESFTEGLKRYQLFSLDSPYFAPDMPLRNFEEDHLIPLGLGGSPADLRNLWPEPRFGRWSARLKDRLEDRLHTMVCRGELRIEEAQHDIAADWIAAYRKYLGEPAAPK
jgi:hypothetical protein